MEKTVTLGELRKGDILLYEGAKGDPLGNLIKKVTGSIVTHTAMVHRYENGRLYVVEETLPTAQVIITNDPKGEKGSETNRVGRTVHVLRLKGTGEAGIQDAVSKAEWYAGNPALPFAIDSFMFSLIYLLFNKAFAEAKYHKIIMDIVELAMLEMDGWANGKMEKGYPMVCSQFAYHCYKETGHIIELSEDRTCDLLEDIKKLLGEKQELKLTDVLPKNMLKQKNVSPKNYVAAEEASRILKEINRVEAMPAVHFEAAGAVDTAWIKKILEFLVKLAGDLVKNFNPEDFTISHFLDLMTSVMYDYFVSPGDLYNAENLERLGVLEYKEK